MVGKRAAEASNIKCIICKYSFTLVTVQTSVYATFQGEKIRRSDPP